MREWDNRGFSLAFKPYRSEDQIAVTVSQALIPVLKTQSCSTVTDVLGNNWSITWISCLCRISSARNTKEARKHTYKNPITLKHIVHMYEKNMTIPK